MMSNGNLDGPVIALADKVSFDSVAIRCREAATPLRMTPLLSVAGR